MSSSDRSNYIIGLAGLATGCLVGAYLSKKLMEDAYFYDMEGCHKALNSNESSTIHMNDGRSKRFLDQTDLTMSLDSIAYANGGNSTINYAGYSAMANFPNVSKNRTLMARYLTSDMYQQYHGMETLYKTTLDMCIQAGVDNPDKMSCGLVAGDEKCYDVYSKLFDPVITDRHFGFTRNNADGFGSNILNLKKKLKIEHFDTDYVKSVHFLIGRCVSGYRFPPTCSRAERHYTENLLKTCLQSLEGEYSGTYYHLPQLDLLDLQGLPDILQSVAICPTSSTMKSSGAIRDWPNGRGVFYSSDRKLFAWTNREDHLRLMYRVRDKKVLSFMDAFKSFNECMNQFDTILKDNGAEFVHHEKFGYLLTCPSGIGTALRAGAHVQLPRLMMDSRFKTILKELRLHIGSEDTGSIRKGFIDIYNMDRLGFTEEELVEHVAGAINLLVEMEKRLELGDEIDDLMPKNTAKNKTK